MARLAAFDMDGTLLLPTHRLGAETLQSLNALHQRGVTLAFATGRHLLDMQAVRQQITLPARLITGNGTRIHDVEGRQLYGCDLAPSVAEEVLHSHWQTPASIHIFNDEGWFTDKPLPGLLEAHAMSGFHYQLRDLRRMPAHEVTKICFIAPHEMLLALKIELQQALGDRASLCFSAGVSGSFTGGLPQRRRAGAVPASVAVAGGLHGIWRCDERPRNAGARRARFYHGQCHASAENLAAAFTDYWPLRDTGGVSLLKSLDDHTTPRLFPEC